MDRSIILMAIVWAIYLFVLLPLYLFKEKQDGSVKAVHYKIVLSAIFCAIGLASAFLLHADAFSALISAGLLFAMGGDYFLVYIKTDERKFFYGILCFGITQVFYIAAMASIAGFSYMEFIIASGVIALAVIGKILLKMDLGKVEFPLTVYFGLVIFMAVKAVSMALPGNSSLTMQLLFSTGAFLFLASDIFLGINGFIKSKRIFSYLVGIFYFLGQLMIATAAFFQK